MAMQQQSETNVETSVVELSEPLEYRELTPYEPQELPTIYPGADRSLLTHEQKLAVNAYEDRYREATESLHELRLKWPGTRLAVAGIFIEDDVEVPALDQAGNHVVEEESGKVQMTLKDFTYIRTLAARVTTGRPAVENEVYYSTGSPIAKRFFKRLVDDYNAGHMGNFQREVPIEVFNKLYKNTHTGIGLRVVEEL